jgi:predicted permease
MDYISELKESYIIVAIAMLSVIIVVYMEKRTVVNKKGETVEEGKNYFKYPVIVGLLVALTVYINSGDRVLEQITPGPPTF